MMLAELDKEQTSTFFNYHIYFLDSSPDNVKNRMLYISTDITKNETKTTMVDDLWSVSKVGIPDWSKELSDLSAKYSEMESVVFFSGPSKLRAPLKRECKNKGIIFQMGLF